MAEESAPSGTIDAPSSDTASGTSTSTDPSSSPQQAGPPSQQPSNRQHISLRSLADAPVDTDATDRLGFQALADGIADLIRGQDTATPLTIAISAPWGAGKTSLLNLVRNRLINEADFAKAAPHIVLSFNAWMHDAAPNLSAALAADIARSVTRLRGSWTRLLHPLPSSMLSPRERARRKLLLAVVAVVPALALALLSSHSVLGRAPRTTASQIGVASGYSVSWLAFLGTVCAVWSRIRGGVAAVATYVDDPAVAAANGSMPEVSDQLQRLIQEARDAQRRRWLAQETPRVVVIIDDLERCEPPKAVDVCQVAAQILDHEGIVTILVGDLQVIASSAELKFGEAAKKYRSDNDGTFEGWQGFGRSFLQKVVQFELELPPTNPQRLRELAISPPTTASILGQGFGAPRRTIAQRMRSSNSLITGGNAPAVARGITGAVVASAAALATGAATGSFRHLADFLSWGMAVLVTMLAAVGIGWLQRKRSKQRQAFEDSLEALVQEVIAQAVGRVGSTSITSLESEVLSELTKRTNAREWRQSRYWDGAQQAIGSRQIQLRLQRLAAEDSYIFRQAETVISDLLPLLPRTAKRMLNRLYFLLVVCQAKDVMGRGGVTAKEIGKWAVLLDRWPDLARLVVKNPGLVGALENLATNKDQFCAQIGALDPPLTTEPSKLWEFFTTAPMLDRAAGKLAYLDPDPPVTRPVTVIELPDALGHRALASATAAT